MDAEPCCMASLSLNGTPGINPVTNAFGKAEEGLQTLPEEMEMLSMTSPSCCSSGAARHVFCQQELSDGSEGFFSWNHHCLLLKQIGIVSENGKRQGFAQRNCGGLIMESEL